MIFETHAHYDDKMFDEDRESLLESMQEAGITEFNSYSLAEILLEGREYVGEAFEPVYLKDAAAIFELCRG